MLPLKDDVPSRNFALVTLLLITANIATFLYQLSLEVGASGAGRGAATGFVLEFGAVPCRITGLCAADEFPSPVVTVFTSMFLHGGFLHLAGNMLYLWIFGDNVEDTLGHLRFVVLYLVSGIGAAIAQVVTSPDSRIPMVGASGAISGVLGAYLFLYPRARILTLIIFGFSIRFVHVPAVIVLGFWIIMQVVSGLVSFGAGSQEGGVAWFAHIGGFVAGVALLFLLKRRGMGTL
jgi:membrane associated rhomboid family serine protease